MNDLRTAIVGFVAVVVGFGGAWMVFGAKATQLEEEVRILREQRGNQVTHSVVEAPVTASQLVGQWATTVSKSRLGRIELIFVLRDDGSVLWQSVQQNKITTMAEGSWRLEGDDVRFTVKVVDERSPEKGQEKSATAHILEISDSCLSLEVEGDVWAFHRTSA